MSFTLNERIIESDNVQLVIDQFFLLGQTEIGEGVATTLEYVLQESGRFDSFQSDVPLDTSPIKLKFTIEIVV